MDIHSYRVCNPQRAGKAVKRLSYSNLFSYLCKYWYKTWAGDGFLRLHQQLPTAYTEMAFRVFLQHFRLRSKPACLIIHISLEGEKKLDNFSLTFKAPVFQHVIFIQQLSSHCRLHNIFPTQLDLTIRYIPSFDNH